MSPRLTHVPLDIETTGFDVDDRVTTVGFALPLGCRIFCNTGGRTVDADGLAEHVESTFQTSATVSCHETERALLEAVTSFASASLAPREYLLVAYNGECYRGGFDLPFLRSRYAVAELRWPFADLPYVDLLPVVRDRFNTTADGSDRDDLEGAYGALVDGSLSEADPFEDSAAAVDAFADGAFRPLVAHNVADVLRTAALADVAERYCGTSEFSMKRLTPTAHDPALEGDAGG